MDNQTESEIFYDLVTGSSAVAALSDCLVQSYLFCSKDTDALMLLVRFLIKSENKDKENSADVVYFDGDKVLTADIEKITSTANLTPLELDYKYYVLVNGQTMNDSAANKLLKTLEEPPQAVKIIILADDEYSVLPTIRSRCRVVNFPPLPQETLGLAADKAFEGLPKDALNRIKSLALGSISRMKKAAAGEYDEAEKAVFACLTGLKSSANAAKYSHLLGKLKSGLSEAIDFFELVFSDVLFLKYGCIPILKYANTQLEEIARFYSAETIIRFKPVLMQARTRLKFSGNAASITDEFLFSLLEIRQKCQA